MKLNKKEMQDLHDLLWDTLDYYIAKSRAYKGYEKANYYLDGINVADRFLKQIKAELIKMKEKNVL